MDAAFTAEQDEMRRTLREILGKRCGPDEVKAAVRTAAGHDRELWGQLSAQLGLPGMAVAEEYGGVGCTPPTWRWPARRPGGCCCPRRCWPPPCSPYR